MSSEALSDITPVDAVIAWVDGNDPLFVARRNRWLEHGDDILRDDIAGEARYAECGELLFCLASLLRFAPFLRKIFIVTDRQQPDIQPLLRLLFPDRADDVAIVDHTVIFRGYEKYLPVFNSLVFDSMIWRIPGLAEHFIYLNDDMMLLSPLTRRDLFTPDGRCVAYVRRVPTLSLRLLRALKHLKPGHKTFGFKDSMLNGPMLFGSSVTPMISHTPHALRVSSLRHIYEERPELIDINCRHRVRHPEQFNPQVLHHLLSPCEEHDFRGKVLFLKPKQGRHGYLERKLREADKMPDLLFGCMNSFDQTTPAERRMFISWMAPRLFGDDARKVSAFESLFGS